MTDVPEEAALRASKAGLRKKVTKYLAELLKREIDIDDTSNPWGAWFKDGYLLRNRAIHEGEVLDHESVERAFAQSAASSLISSAASKQSILWRLWPRPSRPTLGPVAPRTACWISSSPGIADKPAAPWVAGALEPSVLLFISVAIRREGTVESAREVRGGCAVARRLAWMA
jgi:hypothetical protein